MHHPNPSHLTIKETPSHWHVIASFNGGRTLRHAKWVKADFPSKPSPEEVLQAFNSDPLSNWPLYPKLPYRVLP